MEQLVILVIIGLISLVNWIIQRSSEVREKRKLEQKRLGIPEGNPYHSPPEAAPPEPEVRRPAGDPGAEMRRLMEALGLPLEDEPPAVRRAPEPPPPPPLPPIPAFEKVRPPVRQEVRAPAKPAQTAAPAAVVTSRPESPWATALRSRGGVRQAIVLREILGPPKAFSL